MMIEATSIPSSDQDIEPSRKPTRHARSGGLASGVLTPPAPVFAEKGFDCARRSARECGCVV